MAGAIYETRSAASLLPYLESAVLGSLPEELWDGYLWLYGEILPLLGAPLTEYETDRTRMFTSLDHGVVTGVAVAAQGPQVRVHVHGATAELAAELVSRCCDEAGSPNEVSFVDAAQAAAVRSSLFPDSGIVGTRKLWTREPVAPEAPVPGREVRELRAADARLFEAVGFADGTRGWPGFRGCLESGVRYFGSFVDGRLVSIAGLCRLSRSRSEIISVGTFRVEDRGKGHATAATRQALAAALETSRICSWTAGEDNAASIRAARRLGMREYLARYDLRPSRAV